MLTMHNGSRVLCADLKLNHHGEGDGYVLAEYHDELVTWHVQQDEHGVWFASAGRYFDATSRALAEADYDRRRGHTPEEPILGTEYSAVALTEPRWAQRLADEAEAAMQS